MKHAKGHAFFMGLCLLPYRRHPPSLDVCVKRVSGGERGALDVFVFYLEEGSRTLNVFACVRTCRSVFL